VIGGFLITGVVVSVVILVVLWQRRHRDSQTLRLRVPDKNTVPDGGDGEKAYLNNHADSFLSLKTGGHDRSSTFIEDTEPDVERELGGDDPKNSNYVNV
jgi:hypothetical protein